MSDLLPEGEDLRRAVKWIGERRKEEPALALDQLIEEASRRFDLSPLDAEFLWRHLARP